MPDLLDSVPRLKVFKEHIGPSTSKTFRKTQINQRDAAYYLYNVENFLLIKFKYFPRLNEIYDDF